MERESSKNRRYFREVTAHCPLSKYPKGESGWLLPFKPFCFSCLLYHSVLVLNLKLPFVHNKGKGFWAPGYRHVVPLHIS